jgi:hypothetical protein
MRRFPPIIVQVLLLTALAHSQSPAGAVREFGLLGTWAPHCSRPPAPANPYADYALTPEGTIELRNDFGPDYDDMIYDKSYVDNYRTPHTEQFHAVERFKLIEDGRKLQVLLTINDPGAFNLPWSALQRWRRLTDRPIVENLCAENNIDFFGYDDYPIPQATKSDF